MPCVGCTVRAVCKGCVLSEFFWVRPFPDLRPLTPLAGASGGHCPGDPLAHVCGSDQTGFFGRGGGGVVDQGQARLSTMVGVGGVWHVKRPVRNVWVCCRAASRVLIYDYIFPSSLSQLVMSEEGRGEEGENRTLNTLQRGSISFPFTQTLPYFSIFPFLK